MSTLNPKDKAEELVNKMLDKLHNNNNLSIKRILYAIAVECAIESVKEIIASKPISPLKSQYIMLESEMLDEAREYWQQVLIEIENYYLFRLVLS